MTWTSTGARATAQEAEPTQALEQRNIMNRRQKENNDYENENEYDFELFN